jgi:hypothetical protein
LIDESGNPVYSFQNGMFFVECYDAKNFVPIQLLYNGKWIRIDPSAYIFDVVGDGSICILLIVRNSYEFALIGQPLF